ncbi:MAG: M6 family metalloprotease domain-containing protein [candidate division WOR-3 bacterium]
MRVTIVLMCAGLTAAMPPGPYFAGPEPVFPPGVEEPGPNLLAGYGYCETVTILMQFPDNRADTIKRSPACFDSMLYSTGVYNQGPYRAGSLNDYFLENSYGTYDVRGEIAGNRWFLSQYNYSRYYDGNYMLSTGSQMARENIQQVDPYVDFRQFDLNSDGYIDAMFMVHAGADGADNGNVNCCWSHAIPSFNYLTQDGVRIRGVTNVPEFAMVTPARETTMCCIAVMCHELGHLVGLPDLYQSGRTQWGVGYWGLMGYGAWGAGGNTPWSPSHMEAWSKVTAGFVVPTVITQNTYGLRILDVETHPVIYKVWRNGQDRDTCFYLENRQKKGFDSPLPGAGLAIWHIDPYHSAWYDRVDMEEDSTFHLDKGFGYRPDPHIYHQELGDTSDVLPGIWNRVLFDSTSVPSSRDRQNRSTKIAISNIREAGDTIVCDVTLDGSVPVAEGGRAPYASRGTLEVRPNPVTSGVTTLRIHGVEGCSGQSASLRVFDAIGQCILVCKMPFGSWQPDIKLDLRTLRAGVYLVRLDLDGLTQTHRIVVASR